MHETHVKDKKRIAGPKYEEIHGKKKNCVFCTMSFTKKTKKTETLTFYA